MKKVCPKCKALNGENADKCRVCGYVFTAEDNYAAVKSHRTFTPKYSGTFSTIAVVIGVAFGVIGIILGALSAEEGFNVMLALYTWITGAAIALIFWAVFCHLSNQEKQIEMLEEISDHIIALESNKKE